jgi:hypothetical protein
LPRRPIAASCRFATLVPRRHRARCRISVTTSSDLNFQYSSWFGAEADVVGMVRFRARAHTTFAGVCSEIERALFVIRASVRSNASSPPEDKSACFVK